jgi:hypothetical protein
VAERLFRNLRNHGLDHVLRLSPFRPSLHQLTRFRRDRLNPRFRLLCLSEGRSSHFGFNTKESRVVVRNRWDTRRPGESGGSSSFFRPQLELRLASGATFAMLNQG